MTMTQPMLIFVFRPRRAHQFRRNL